MFQNWVRTEFNASITLAEQWLRNHFNYRDEIEEIIRTPEFMLQEFEQSGYVEGDCDDIATLTAAITKSQGVPTRLTAIQANNPEEYDHVFSEVRIGSAWLPIDITVPVGTEYKPFGVMSEWV